MTKIYFHDAISSLIGTLPSSQQSGLTVTESVDAASVNRTMDTTIGTAQASKAITVNIGTQRVSYFTRFCSQPLNQTSISANTWNYAYAAQQSATTMQFTTPTGTSNAIKITCYVWRPSNGSKVGDILIGDSTANFGVTASTLEKSTIGTFAGSAVTCQVNDIICMEIIFQYTPTTGSKTGTFYYDGTTETNNDGTTVSNHASYIETPESLSFVSAAAIPQTVYIEWEEA